MYVYMGGFAGRKGRERENDIIIVSKKSKNEENFSVVRLKMISESHTWWLMSVIPAFRRLREEDPEFEPGLHTEFLPSLDYIPSF